MKKYVRFVLAKNVGFEVEVRDIDFRPLINSFFIQDSFTKLPKLVKCDQFISIKIIDKDQVGIDYTFYRNLDTAFNLNNVEVDN